MRSMTMIAVEDDFLVEHLDEMPDDGNRYELVDGLLLVSPSGTERHQRALVGTRRHDLAVKRGAYERAGVLS